MKKIKTAFFFVLITSLVLVTAIVAAKEDLARLEIINKSDRPATLVLVGDKASYALTVPADTTRLFTVEREIYTRTTIACGETDTGTVDLQTRTRLVFTSCFGDAPNMGEPSMEKVHIPDSPTGAFWYYK
jgi:hypothetical protein